MKQYEYVVRNVTTLVPDIGIDLAEHGLKGWELISVIGKEYNWYYFFKKEIQ